MGVSGVCGRGSAAWAAEVRLDNHRPNVVFLNTRAHEDLMVLAGGDGTNSSKLWLGAPAALEGVSTLPTTGWPLANAIAGDFSYAVWGIRTDAMIEVTADADGAFEKHQVKFKITFRGDVGVTDASAFHRLAGITS